MLKKIRITNFLSCKDTEIELDQVTALIGRNAAGKTNILKTIQWCAQFATGNIPLYEYFGQPSQLEIECSIEFLIDNQYFKYEIKITSLPNNNPLPARKFNVFLPENSVLPALLENLFAYKDGSWKLIAKRNNEYAEHHNGDDRNDLKIKSEAPMMVFMRSLLPDNKLNPAIDKVFDYLLSVKYYPLEVIKYDKVTYDKSASIVEEEVYNEWLSNKDNEQKSLVVMKLLHLWHVDKDTLKELEELIGKNGLNLIDNVIIEESRYGRPGYGSNFYILRFNIANTIVNYNQLSYGTQRVLSILLVLLHDKSATLLIEQPEDGIHSGLLRKLLPLCFEYAAVYNKQIIISTHSPDVINLLPPESIRLVKMTENGTKVSSLNKGQLPFIYEFLEDEGALFDFIESMDDE